MDEEQSQSEQKPDNQREQSSMTTAEEDDEAACNNSYKFDNNDNDTDDDDDDDDDDNAANNIDINIEDKEDNANFFEMSDNHYYSCGRRSTRNNKNKPTKQQHFACSAEPTSSRIHQRKPHAPNANANPVTPPDYSQDQLNLVTKINAHCRSFYEVLNVSNNAADSEIKRAYKRLALQLHPDKNRAPGAAEAFKTLGTAVTVLTDERKRKDYDDAGAVGLSSKIGGRSPFPQTNTYQNTYGQAGQSHPYSYESTFSHDDLTAEELFNMFFGAYPMYRQRRTAFERAYPFASSPSTAYEQHHQSHQQPSLAFGLILVLILISVLSSFFTSDPIYSLQPSTKFSVRRQTQQLSVPYYVKETFEREYDGSVGRLENSVEEDFVYTMKQNCYRERNYHAMDELIEKLLATSITDASAAETTTTLLHEISATKDPKLFDKHELAQHFLALISADDASVRREASKCVAEITKSEVQRKKFTSREVIEKFLSCLRNLQDASSVALPIQICRALGNICYLNEEARDFILQLKGDEVLFELLDLVDIPDKDNASQFIKVRGGLITNYLLGGEGLAKRAMDLQIMQKLQNIIAQCVEHGVQEQDEDLLLNTLPILSILTENVADLNFDATLNVQLSRILAASTNPDLAEMCLELLHYQAENDKVKLLLAKDGLCETIYNLLEKYKTLASTSEARALMKLACELIVLIVSGDESMKYLYTTPLLKYMEDWLDSQDLDLLTTGVMALGNFARTDSHCIDMVERKVMNKLLEVLSKHNGVNDDWRLQHGLLCTLRNLVITKSNKDAIIQAGLVENILPMLEIHQLPVVFKLLGTLRMTIDGQEKLALELLQNKKLIELLVYWSRSTDYVGVTDESLRLMAWLLKHAFLGKIAYVLSRKGDAPAEQLTEKPPTPDANDRNILKEFIAHDGTVESMVIMLTSQHLVMQNEALIALCILSVMFLAKHTGDSAEEASAQHEQMLLLQETLIKHEVGKKLAELIAKSSDTMTKEIVENLQNFTNLLKTSEKLVAHLEEHNINELLKSIPILTEYCTL